MKERLKNQLNIFFLFSLKTNKQIFSKRKINCLFIILTNSTVSHIILLIKIFIEILFVLLRL